MQIVSISYDEIYKEINDYFPYVLMPPTDKLVIHNDDCYQCQYLKKDLIELYSNKTILDEPLIRSLHMELLLLTPESWFWIMPSYLRYCLSREPYIDMNYGDSVTEFLTYQFEQTDFQSKTDIMRNISLFNVNQLNTLKRFFIYLSSSSYWEDDASLKEAINFFDYINPSV